MGTYGSKQLLQCQNTVIRIKHRFHCSAKLWNQKQHFCSPGLSRCEFGECSHSALFTCKRAELSQILEVGSFTVEVIG